MIRRATKVDALSMGCTGQSQTVGGKGRLARLGSSSATSLYRESLHPSTAPQQPSPWLCLCDKPEQACNRAPPCNHSQPALTLVPRSSATSLNKPVTEHHLATTALTLVPRSSATSLNKPVTEHRLATTVLTLVPRSSATSLNKPVTEHHLATTVLTLVHPSASPADGRQPQRRTSEGTWKLRSLQAHDHHQV